MGKETFVEKFLVNEGTNPKRIILHIELTEKTEKVINEIYDLLESHGNVEEYQIMILETIINGIKNKKRIINDILNSLIKESK